MAVDGIYEIALKTPMGNQKGKLDLKAEGTVLTGTAQVMGASVPLENGKVDGDAFEFQVEANTPMGKIKITMKMKVDGDALSGEATTPFGPAPVTGTRV